MLLHSDVTKVRLVVHHATEERRPWQFGPVPGYSGALRRRTVPSCAGFCSVVSELASDEEDNEWDEIDEYVSAAARVSLCRSERQQTSHRCDDGRRNADSTKTAAQVHTHATHSHAPNESPHSHPDGRDQRTLLAA